MTTQEKFKYVEKRIDKSKCESMTSTWGILTGEIISILVLFNDETFDIIYEEDLDDIIKYIKTGK